MCVCVRACVCVQSNRINVCVGMQMSSLYTIYATPNKTDQSLSLTCQWKCRARRAIRITLLKVLKPDFALHYNI